MVIPDDSVESFGRIGWTSPKRVRFGRAKRKR
jgi:hypothetical protein